MQKANCIVRLGGDLTNTVPKSGVTPAEVLILRHLHGDDAVVDIRPYEFDKRVRVEAEFDRLSARYDNGGGFGASPGEERVPVTQKLFPGAMKRLPLTFAEIGEDVGGPGVEDAPGAPAEPEPEVVDEVVDEPELPAEGREEPVAIGAEPAEGGAQAVTG